MDKPRKTRAKRETRAKYIPKKRVCAFCVEKVKDIDYKNVAILRRYISDRGRIDPRRRTGTCARHQRALTRALKRARHLALLPFTTEHLKDTSPQAPTA